MSLYYIELKVCKKYRHVYGKRWVVSVVLNQHHDATRQGCVALANKFIEHVKPEFIYDGIRVVNSKDQVVWSKKIAVRGASSVRTT